MDPRQRRTLPVDALVAVAIAVGLLLVATSAWAQPAPPETAETNPGYRTKINTVDVREAPLVKVRATFLNPRDVPINPELIDQYDVFIDDERIDSKRIKLGVWAEEEDGSDVVIVVPATAALGAQGKTAISKILPQMIKGLTERDRAALVTYTRAVTVRFPLDTAKDALPAKYNSIKPVGIRPFMFSSLNTALSVLEASPDNRKKAIIYVGEGTDASTYDVEAINQKLKEVVVRANRADVSIWTIGYWPSGLDDVDVRSLDILARKTGATYRRAESARDLSYHLDNALGEIVGELVVKVDWDFEEDTAYKFAVRFQSAKSPEVDSLAYDAKVNTLKINWLFWSIFCGVACFLTFIGSIIGYFSYRSYRKRKAKENAEKVLADVLADDDDEEGMIQQKKIPPPFVYDDKGNKLCNLCGKEAEAGWTKGCVGPVPPGCRYFGKENAPLPEWREAKDREAIMLGQMDPEELAAKMMADQE